MMIFKWLFVALPVIYFFGCSPTINMRTWSSTEDYDKQFKKLLVMGLVNNVNLRNDVENEVVHAARKAELLSVNGMSLFPPELGKPFEDTERVKSRLREGGFDGIITVTLIDIQSERYIPPNSQYRPLVYYDRFRNYYYQTYELVYKQGYYAGSTRYFIETNLYELAQGKLVWSGRSASFEPLELENNLPKYASTLFDEFKREGIILK
jgi:hypothetical protein